MVMDNTLVIAIVFFILAIVICALWWLRYYEKKLMAQRIINGHSRSIIGRGTMNVYHINVGKRLETPPPTFSKALKCSVPVYADKEEPPPSYKDYLKTQLAAQDPYPYVVVEKPASAQDKSKAVTVTEK